MYNEIQKYLDKRKMSQSELGQAVNVSRPYVNGIINGRTQPGVELAVRIARALNTTVEKLWFEGREGQ